MHKFQGHRSKVMIIRPTNAETGSAQWWRRLVNAYEVRAGMVCLQCNNSVIHTNLSASVASFSQRGAIQIYLPFVSYLKIVAVLQ